MPKPINLVESLRSTAQRLGEEVYSLRSENAYLTKQLDDLQAEHRCLLGDFIRLSNQQVAAEKGVLPGARRN